MYILYLYHFARDGNRLSSEGRTSSGTRTPGYPRLTFCARWADVSWESPRGVPYHGVHEELLGLTLFIESQSGILRDSGWFEKHLRVGWLKPPIHLRVMVQPTFLNL